MLLYYFVIKTAFLVSLLRAYLKFDPLKDHYLFISILYTAGIGFLSWLFLVAGNSMMSFQRWEFWLAETFALSTIYFWLLSRFDEGLVYVVVLVGGTLLLIWF